MSSLDGASAVLAGVIRRSALNRHATVDWAAHAATQQQDASLRRLLRADVLQI